MAMGRTGAGHRLGVEHTSPAVAGAGGTVISFRRGRAYQVSEQPDSGIHLRRLGYSTSFADGPCLPIELTPINPCGVRSMRASACGARTSASLRTAPTLAALLNGGGALDRQRAAKPSCI